MSSHVVEVGPTVIRQLCCGGQKVAHDAMVAAAFDSIDDPVALADLRPVTLDALWRTALVSIDCGSPERTTVVHPSWWTPRRIAVIRGAAQVLAGEVVLRPRSWLLTQSRRATLVVEIADSFVVITGTAVVAETRRREQQCVVGAVVGSILQMTSDANTAVVIDAPTTVGGASGLAAMIADGLQARGGVGSVQIVDDARFKRFAAEIIRDEGSSCELDVARRDYRRHSTAALVVLLTVAVLGVLGALASVHRGAPADDGVSTTFLTEGHVAVEVPAQWPTQRVVAGPGSARVQVTSPSDPEMALHVTQSRIAVEALSATAEVLKRAIDAQPAGVFVDFNPSGNVAGRRAVTYREVRPSHDIRWTVLVDKTIRISIGCQSRHGHEDGMRQVCELAVRSARALS